LIKVAKGVAENCKHDEALAYFTIQGWLATMEEKKWLGDKTGQGFFKKVKTPEGKSDIQVLNLKTLEYEPRKKPKFATLEAAKPIEDLAQRIKVLSAGTDKAGEFYKQFHYALFSYISHRIPEISDELYRVDDAMMAGFGWEIGAFESWDILGVVKTTEAIKAAGYAIAPWVDDMIASGATSFYKIENGKRLYYDVTSQSYKTMPGGEAFIVMKNFVNQTVWKNSVCRTYHLGEDVLGLEWYTKWVALEVKC
ncbi:MAG: 3-hydroxyacyl-CoA dehydrogenase, partial [Ferruginibacter sp.]